VRRAAPRQIAICARHEVPVARTTVEAPRRAPPAAAPVRHGHAELVVVGLVAEHAGHATAAGVKHGELQLGMAPKGPSVVPAKPSAFS